MLELLKPRCVVCVVWVSHAPSLAAHAHCLSPQGAVLCRRYINVQDSYRHVVWPIKVPH